MADLSPYLSALDARREAIAALRGQSMLVTAEWSRERLDALVAVAEAFAAFDRAGIKTPLSPHELAYALFFDNSTRTRSAWAGAASRLGMQPVVVPGSATQVSHGETAEETGAMLGMNAHALGVRHDLILGEGTAFMRSMLQGITDYLEATDDPRGVPMVNLQCDLDHPTQTTADLLWLREYFGGAAGLKGKKIAVSWAYSPSYAKPLSVPQGLIMLLPRFGAEVVLAHPEGYPLLDESVEYAKRGAEEGGGAFSTTDDMDAAFRGADVVYPKSWGPIAPMRDRIAANQAGDTAEMAEIERRALAQNAKYTDWICDERRMSLTKGGNALYMHCLPADPGAEVAMSVLDAHRVNVAREAHKKVYAIMALLAAAKVDGLVDKLRDLAP